MRPTQTVIRLVSHTPLPATAGNRYAAVYSWQVRKWGRVVAKGTADTKLRAEKAAARHGGSVKPLPDWTPPPVLIEW